MKKNGEYCIHLENEATDWENATPIGNGSMGAMIYGTVATEQLQINEESIWSGNKPHVTDVNLNKKIEYIRDLLLSGKTVEANKWAQENTKDSFGRIGSYETAGEVLVKMHPSGSEFTEYSRDLNLNSGLATVSYCIDGIKYKRDIIASNPDKIIAMKVSCEKKNNLNAEVFYERLAEFDSFENCNEPLCFQKYKNCINIDDLKSADNTITVCGKTVRGNHNFCVKIKALAENGSVYCKERSLIVKNADSFIVFISIKTDFKEKDYIDACESNLLNINKGWDCIKSRHISDFAELMMRSELILRSTDETECKAVPDRLNAIRKGKTDLGLIELYFSFGKYLLISSSRKGTLPSNLQGLWNNKLFAIWNSDYHTNINLQMNYWLAEPVNLSECVFPLFDYINKYLLESGKDTAKRIYGCRGTVVHHLSNIYGFTDPADGLWGLWPLGGAWLCFHFWEHYLFTGDKDFLENCAYEYIYQCTRFFMEYMIEDRNGNLASGPSMSPENKYYPIGSDIPVSLCMSPSMDIEIIGGLFRIFCDVSVILERDSEFRKDVISAIKKMPRLKVGKLGQLMEWTEDYQEPEPGHRHISHLFSLYPDNAITIEKTPELFRAARVSIERRLANGGGHTGWSRAWLINLFARLKDGENAYRHLELLFKRSTNDNLLDTHPPFQIDGNFGGCAGICEMLVQSHENKIALLPACPHVWKSGEIRRFVARGNIEISLAWENGNVIWYELKSLYDTKVEIDLPMQQSKSICLKAGKTVHITT